MVYVLIMIVNAKEMLLTAAHVILTLHNNCRTLLSKRHQTTQYRLSAPEDVPADVEMRQLIGTSHAPQQAATATPSSPEVSAMQKHKSYSCSTSSAYCNSLLLY